MKTNNSVSSHLTTVQTATGKRKKPTSVWLIDDNDIDNFISRKVLEKCGLTNILTFTSTTTALQHLTQTKDFLQFILLDLVLPIMDGFEFLDELAKLKIARQPIVICVLTTSVNPADREKARQKNCAFIEKPLTADELFVNLTRLTKAEEEKEEANCSPQKTTYYEN